MTARILIRPRAQADIDDTAEYLGQDNPATATRFRTATEETFQDLLGHTDPRTTRTYARAKRKVTRNIVDRISI